MLYTSGSTAKPKGILHTTGGYLTGVAWTTKHVFDLKPDEDVFWCSADVGWVTGHSYIVYGPLHERRDLGDVRGRARLSRTRTSGGSSCERYGVTVFYTAPTAIRACMKWGAEHPQKHDLSSLRLLGTVGEPINPKAWLWYWKVIGGERCPVVDTWWQTETGHIMITHAAGGPVAKPGSAGKPLPGIDAAVLDEEGNEVRRRAGPARAAQPWPGMLRTLFKDDERFKETYFSKWDETTYFVGDAARKDEDGYFWVVGRVDDVVNVSGHRLSTAEVESAIVSHPKVAEAAVIGQQDEDTGQSIAAFVILEGENDEGDEQLEQELREHVATRIGKLARPKRIIWTADVPKTRSGKIMRRLLRDIAEGRELGDVTTLREPGVMKDLEGEVRRRGGVMRPFGRRAASGGGPLVTSLPLSATPARREHLRRRAATRGLMRYVITGGSGYIGSRLVDLLARRDDTEKIVDLRRRPAARATGRKTEFERVDVRDRQAVRRCSSGCARTCSCTSRSSSTRRTTRSFMYDVDVNGTHNVLEAAGDGRARARCWSPRRRSPTAPSPTTRCRSPRTTRCAAWPASPTRATRPSRTASASSGPRTHPDRVMTIVRPCIVFGPNVDNYLVRLWTKQPFAVDVGHARPATSSSCTRTTWSRRITGLLLGRHGGAYNVAGDGLMTMRECAELIGVADPQAAAAGLPRAGARRCGSCAPVGGAARRDRVRAPLRGSLSNEKLKRTTGWAPDAHRAARPSRSRCGRTASCRPAEPRRGRAARCYAGRLKLSQGR